MTYEFGSEQLRCVVSELGAELISVKTGAKEWLWQNDNGGWAGHSPVLFPYGGRCAMVENGVKYPCPFHGFLMAQTFTLVEKTETSVVLTARSNEETKRLYPHDFSLFITYMVVGNCLKITYKAVNEGKDTMYAAFCCHESYNLDGEVDEYEAVFENEEHFLSYYAKDNDGRLTGEAKDFGHGTVYPFPREFLQTESVIFKDIASRKVTLRKRGCEEPLAVVTFPDFSHLLFWHPADSRMICIEPWQNLPDDLHAEPQEFSKKSGTTAVKPGEALETYHEIVYYSK